MAPLGMILFREFGNGLNRLQIGRSEEHTSELQSRPHSSYAGFCLEKKKKKNMLKSYPHLDSQPLL